MQGQLVGGYSDCVAKSELLRSHDELRGALILAGREIRKLSFGRKDTPVLRKLREVLKDARMVAKAERGRAGK